MANWRIKARYFEACNCAHGCPCNFNGFPNDGFCDGVVAFAVDEGQRDDVDLTGVKVVAAVQWPGAIHEGNGKLAAFIDAASEAQREAIGTILMGKDGGMPWEILAATVSEVHGPFFETIEIEDRGTDSRVRVGEKVLVQMESFKNPVTGEPHEVHTVLPTGFIFKDGLVCNSAAFRVSAEGVSFEHPGRNCYYAEVEWSSAEQPVEASPTKFA